MPDLKKLGVDAKAWPFAEARSLLKRVGETTPKKGYVLFETGYGPSGLPHIGTFAEVVRTTMVRQAFEAVSDIPTKLFVFSDDMDGLRKVPDNVPQKEMMAEHLGKPLTGVPDPFGSHESFGAHNNARLKAFLNTFDFDYEFKSATECYKTGQFDGTLLQILKHHDDINDVIKPTLGEERRATYSPFLPVCRKTGRVLLAEIVETKPDSGTIVYKDEDGLLVETPVTGGHCKLQWKADWAMRWTALNVDYEMSGKDLIDSVRLSGNICRLLGGKPPEGFTYELFLDENGEKISKSRGNGISVEEWLEYATPESLSLYMYNSPKKAKRLFFDAIPRHVDDYLVHLGKYYQQEEAAQLENPTWHIHNGLPPKPEGHVTFGLLLNLVSVCNTEDPGVLWGFITRYASTATPETAPILDRLVLYAIAYYRDFVKPEKSYRTPTKMECAALEDLVIALNALPPDVSAETIQTEVYAVGKRHEFESLRDWFKTLYEVLLGQSDGPRFGSFVALYGKIESIDLIRGVLAGESSVVE
ncbi:MAG: Lysine--tRNA ligase [Alphaproteobacteria bacterium MarineAlpha11_Bin1]|nr:MAG: Lysine--tRNA ligase [Alphaproteobacteria bacterium MarineAlpha11_Bin1]